MITFIDSKPDVFAITVAKRITGDDLDRIMDRLEPMLEGDRKVHVFVETKGIDGIELSGLPRYMSRAMPLFGKLKQFDRVAVVADQTWIRVGVRLESAMLPFVDYKTFEPSERELALAWVEARATAPVEPA